VQVPTPSLLAVGRRTPVADCPVAPPTVAAVVPARNEQDSIRASIVSLLDQTRPPDSIFVVVNNSTDGTFDVARRFTGRRVFDRPGGRVTCLVTVLDIGTNDDRRAGALNLAWSLARHHDFVLTVDANSVLESDGLQALLDEITADGRIGEVSAVPFLHRGDADTGAVGMLVRAQRFEAAAQARRDVARPRSATLQNAQCTLFRSSALGDVLRRAERLGPWMAGDAAEDPRLRIELADAGYGARVSSGAASVGKPLRSLRAVWAQQVKRVACTERLSGNLDPAAGLALRSESSAGLVTHLVSRVLVAVLAVHALVVGVVIGGWLWLLPMLVAVLANVCIAAGMRDRTRADFAYAALLVPHELYRSALSVSHAVAVVHERRGCLRDHGADQTAAEEGERVRVIRFRLVPLLALGGAAASIPFAWAALPVALRDGSGAAAWLVLALLVGMQSLGALRTTVGGRAPVRAPRLIRDPVPR